MDERVFATARLRAVLWRDDHADAAHAAYSDPDFVRYLGSSTPHPTLEHTRDWIRRIRSRYDAAGPGAGFWALERLTDGEPVGATLCQPLPGGDGEHEIGWHVMPAHQGSGYATEAGAGAASYAVAELGLDEVFAVVDPRNAPSLAVARRLGMRELGLTTKYYDGFEAVLFALSRPEIEAAGRAARRP